MEPVLVYIQIEELDAVVDQLAGLVVGLPGLLTTEEYITSKDAVSVNYCGVLQTPCCGAPPSLENILVELHSFYVPSGMPSLQPYVVGIGEE